MAIGFSLLVEQVVDEAYHAFSLLVKQVVDAKRAEMEERDILQTLDHPFIVKLHFSFEVTSMQGILRHWRFREAWSHVIGGEHPTCVVDRGFRHAHEHPDEEYSLGCIALHTINI